MSGMGLEEWCFRADVEVISVAGSVLAGRSMRSVTGRLANHKDCDNSLELTKLQTSYKVK